MKLYLRCGLGSVLSQFVSRANDTVSIAATLPPQRITVCFVAFAAGMLRFVVAADTSANSGIDLPGDGEYKK